MTPFVRVTRTTQPTSAIQDLYDRGIIHRDISIANIMITIDGGGRLIDLDLARDRNEVGARRSVRTVGFRVRRAVELHTS